MAFPIEKHLDGQNKAQLLNFKLNPQAADPVSPVAGIPWYNTTENVFKYFDGTETKTIATLDEITSIGRYRGSWDATQGVPTAAGSANYPGDAIRAGDFWRVSVAGTITGLQGESELEAGDLIFADIPNAAVSGDFFGADTNVKMVAPGDNYSEEVFTGVNLIADTPFTITSTTLSTISSYQVLNGNKDLSMSFDIDVDETGASPELIINSLNSYNGLKVKLSGILS